MKNFWRQTGLKSQTFHFLKYKIGIVGLFPLEKEKYRSLYINLEPIYAMVSIIWNTVVYA